MALVSLLGARLPAMMLAGALLWPWLGRAQAPAPAPAAYELGFRQVSRLESDLYAALESRRRKQVSFETVLLEHVRLPCLASAPRESGPGTPVQVSPVLVDFLNRLAHARAHDETESGFFVSYTRRLGEDARVSSLPDFGAALPKKAWNFQTMNRQASYFNQMAGGLVAVELAHHYLGHYRKHAEAYIPPAAFPRPINALITESEWREAVLVGSENALACGLGSDGLRAVFECFESMSPRPAWAAYFIHPEANVRRVNAELLKQERDFFAMDKHPRRLTSGGGEGAR